MSNPEWLLLLLACIASLLSGVAQFAFAILYVYVVDVSIPSIYLHNEQNNSDGQDNLILFFFFIGIQILFTFTKTYSCDLYKFNFSSYRCCFIDNYFCPCNNTILFV